MYFLQHMKYGVNYLVWINVGAMQLHGHWALPPTLGRLLGHWHRDIDDLSFHLSGRVITREAHLQQSHFAEQEEAN